MRSDSESSSESESKAANLGRRGTGHIRFSTTLALDGEVDREEILRQDIYSHKIIIIVLSYEYYGSRSMRNPCFNSTA